MTVLKKDQILKKNDIKTKVVSVPEWGGDVIISVLSSYARDKFESSIVGKNGGTNTINVRAKLVASCLVNEDGSLMFSEDEAMKLGKKSSIALDRIFSEVQKLNKIGDKDLDELAKN